MRVVDEDAERGAIGCAFLDAGMARRMCRMLDSAWFATSLRRSLWKHVSAVVAVGGSPDLVTARSALGLTDPQVQDLIGMMEGVSGPSNGMVYAQMVKDAFCLRELAGRVKGLGRKINDGDLRGALKELATLGHGLSPETSALIHAKDVSLSPSDLKGISTPWPSLDAATKQRGWPCGEFSIILAETGKGKTVAMTQAADKAADDGKAVLYATYEMGSNSLTRRMVQARCGMWREPHLSEGMEALRSWDDAVSAVSDPYRDLWFYEAAKSESFDYKVEDLSAKVEQMHEAEPLDLLCVDYAQLVGTREKTDSEYRELTLVGRHLMKLASKLGIAVVVGSQGTSQDGRLRTRGSREFENAAGLLLSIPNSQDALVVEKNRHGRGGIRIPVVLDDQRLRFEEVGS